MMLSSTHAISLFAGSMADRMLCRLSVRRSPSPNWLCRGVYLSWFMDCIMLKRDHNLAQDLLLFSTPLDHLSDDLPPPAGTRDLSSRLMASRRRRTPWSKGQAWLVNMRNARSVEPVLLHRLCPARRGTARLYVDLIVHRLRGARPGAGGSCWLTDLPSAFHAAARPHLSRMCRWLYRFLVSR
jgi:hypothetical protein